MATHSMEQVTCAAYGCPGCTYRHFHRGSDDAWLTEVPNVGLATHESGLYTREQLDLVARAAIATGAVSLDD